MRLLRLAVEIQRWDLATHTIVLAAATPLLYNKSPSPYQGEGDTGDGVT